MKKNSFKAERVVLLVEIERYCNDSKCLRLNRIGLTREDARSYKGFECERCEIWNEDELRPRDLPADWWQNSEREL